MLTYIEQLEHKARQRGLSIQQAFSLADIPSSTFSRAMKDGRDVSYGVAIRVWEALECKKVPNWVRSADTPNSCASLQTAASS